MKTHWDRQIEHIVRPVKPTGLRGLRAQLLKAQVKARRGLPSRNLPADLVVAKIELDLGHQRPAGASGHAQAVDRLERAKAHERMMERKRAQRRAARQRARPSVLDTAINLWRRRREWLREAENLSAEPL